jgi:hypothetical protein
MAFEQAAIKVEKEQEFQELKDAIERALSAEKVEQFLKRLGGKGVRVRDFDAALDAGVLDHGSGSGKTTKDLYRALTISDQAQMREFYLFRIEEVEPKLRGKFHKLFRYY